MRTLAIVGSHPRVKETFDFSRDVDIWVFNEAMKQEHFTRADAVFQMHVPAIWRNPNNRNDPKHYEWLKSGDTPVIYMHDKYDDIPMSERYPLDEIVSELLQPFQWTSRTRTDNKYFSSTFCYAMALAIYKGYTDIEVHGVEMETETEYHYQRDGVTFWIGIALGRGIRVNANMDIFDFPLYGYQGEASIDFESFEQRIKELTPFLEAGQARHAECIKQSNEAVADFLNEAKDPQRVIDTLKAQVLAAYDANVFGGAIQENERYQRKAEAMIEEAKSFQFSRQEFEASKQGHSVEYAKRRQEADAAAGACTAYFEDARKHKNATRRREAFKKFADAARAYIEQSMYAGVHYGAMQENAEYLGKLDQLIKAAGGAKSEAVLLEVNNEVSA